MYSITINPISGTLQLIHKAISTKEESKLNKDGKCTLNQIHVAQGDAVVEYTLPSNPKETDWMKIFGHSEKGWILRIPEGQKVVSGMRLLDHTSHIHSNMHRFDFIHLMFLGNLWYIENKSPTVGVS